MLDIKSITSEESLKWQISIKIRLINFILLLDIRLLHATWCLVWPWCWYLDWSTRLSGLKSELESNNAVIIAHVVLVSVYTTLSILRFNVKATDGGGSLTVALRWESAWTLVGGIADLFISCTLWIVTDENQTPLAFRQGNRSTLVLDIIRPTSDRINDEFDELE